MKSWWIIGFVLMGGWRFPPMLKRTAACKVLKAQSQTSRLNPRAAQQALLHNSNYLPDRRMRGPIQAGWRSPGSHVGRVSRNCTSRS